MLAKRVHFLKWHKVYKKIMWSHQLLADGSQQLSMEKSWASEIGFWISEEKSFLTGALVLLNEGMESITQHYHHQSDAVVKKAKPKPLCKSVHSLREKDSALWIYHVLQKLSARIKISGEPYQTDNVSSRELQSAVCGLLMVRIWYNNCHNFPHRK